MDDRGLHLSAHDPPQDITIFMDVSLNPGPDVTGSSIQLDRFTISQVVGRHSHTNSPSTTKYSRKFLLSLRSSTCRLCPQVLGELKSHSLLRCRGGKGEKRTRGRYLNVFSRSTQPDYANFGSLQAPLLPRGVNVNNLISITNIKNDCRCVQSCVLNVRSIKNKTMAVKDFVVDQDVHAMPGPDQGSTMMITTRISNHSRRNYQPHYCPPSPRDNLITIQCSNQLIADRCRQQLVVCNINAQSVRNKSAVILDYICDHTPAIVSLTEHWLTDLDSSVRAELCPNGYKILGHTRSDRRGAGTGIIYHESLHVKKIDAGVSLRNSYEFSEWIVKSGGYSIRIAIIYRPPYSERHLVTTNVFFAEFPDDLESLLLCKERLLITGDFNIHVHDCSNPDTQKFLDLLDSFDLQ